MHIGDIVKIKSAPSGGSLGYIVAIKHGSLQHLYYSIQLFGEKRPVPASETDLALVSSVYETEI